MKTKFTKIDKILKTTSKSYKLEAAIYRHKLIKSWQGVVASFISEASDNTRVIDFKKGVLQVACLSKDLAYKIKLLSKRIIHALNQLLGATVVFSLDVEY